jgi:Uma2 family endonuclease
MTQVTTQEPATYADLEALPDHLTGELFEGTLYVSPKPAGPHILAVSTLAAILSNYFQRAKDGGPGGWWILQDLELHLWRSVLAPDIAGWRKTKMPKVPQDHRFDIAPDWVCEGISPSSRRVDRKIKPPIYHRAQVGHLWLLDAAARTLEVWRYGQEGWIVVSEYGDNDLVRAEPFEAVEIDLLELWGEERPSI